MPKKYEIRFKKSVSKDLQKIPAKDVKRIFSKITPLARDPRPEYAKKLTNQEKYRIRVGLYRILYSIRDDVLIVEVVKIAHRKDVYRV